MAIAAAQADKESLNAGGDDRAKEYTTLADNADVSEKKRQAAMLFSIAEKALMDEESAECLKASEDALALFQELGETGLFGVHDTLRILVAGHRQVASYEHRKPEEALKIAFREEENFRLLGDKRGEASMLLSLAEINADKRGRRKRAHALECVTKAMVYFQEIGDKKCEAMSHIVYGNIQYKMYAAEEVLQANEAAYALYSELGDKLGQAKALHGMGIHYIMGRKFDEAIAKARAAVAIFQEKGARKFEAAELTSIAQWHLASERPKKALLPAEQALAIFRELGTGMISLSWEAMSLFTTCEALIASKQSKAAMKLAKDYQIRYKELGALRGQAMVQEILARVHLAQSAPEKALESVAEARRIVAEIGDKRWAVRLCHGEAASRIVNKDTDEAIQVLERALSMATINGDHREEANCNNELCTIYLSKQDYQKALKHAQAARAISANSQDRKGEACACLNLAVALTGCAQVDEAYTAAHEAQEYFQEVNDFRGEARALSIVAEISLSDGRIEAALEAAEERLTIGREMGDLKLEAHALQQLASLHLRDNNPQEAEKCAKDGRSLFQKAHDMPGEVGVLMTLLQVYLAQAQDQRTPGTKSIVDRALKAAADAVAIAGKTGNRGMRASALYMRAQVLVVADKYQDALRMAEEAAEIYAAMGSKLSEARVLLLIANLQNAFGMRDKAMASAKGALALAEQCKDTQIQEDTKNLIEEIQGPKQQAQQYVPMQQVMQPQEGFASAEVPAAGPAVSIVPQRKGLDPVHVKNKLMQFVKDVIASDDEIEQDSPFMEAGMDSLSSVSLMSIVAKEFQMSLSPSLIFDFPTVRALQEHLVAESMA